MSKLSGTKDWLSELRDIEQAQVSVSNGPDSVEGIAESLGQAEQGWACLASSVLSCIDGRWQNVTADKASASPTAAECSSLLSAEIRLSDTSSLHIWRSADGLHSKVISEGAGTAALVYDDGFVSTEIEEANRHTPRELLYRTYWTQQAADDPTAAVSPWKPFVSRFVGWRSSSI